MFIRWLLEVQASHLEALMFLLSIKIAKKPFTGAPGQVSMCHWLELVDINEPQSVTGQDNGTMVISDQYLPLDRASLCFSQGRGVDNRVDYTDTMRTLLVRKQKCCLGSRYHLFHSSVENT